MEILGISPKERGVFTARVRLENKEADLPCTVWSKDGNDYVTIYGLAVRYRTGTKVWPGSCLYWPANGHINNVRGPQDHRSGRGWGLSVVGFWEDMKDQHKSQHISVVGTAGRSV